MASFTGLSTGGKSSPIFAARDRGVSGEFPNFLASSQKAALGAYLRGKSILITGGTGSFGNALVKVLLEQYEPRRIIVFSRDELKQSVMQQKFPIAKYPNMRYFLGDVRDAQRLKIAFRDVQVIFHAAALKQVPALEYNPTEAIKTNINGAMNIVNTCIFADSVERVVALSTDKAANPINLYGATKLCSDKIYIAGNNYTNSGTAFSVVRYGNVFGSRGSIVPVLHKLRETGMVGLTDVRMTRYNITVGQAIEFVLAACSTMGGGEIFVPKLPSYRLPDVAKAITPDCTVKVIGRRPGEKLHELMVPADEAYKTVDCGFCYVICPDDWSAEKKAALGRQLPEDFSYTSGNNVDWCTPLTLRLQYKDWCKAYGYDDSHIKLGDQDIVELTKVAGAAEAAK